MTTDFADIHRFKERRDMIDLEDIEIDLERLKMARKEGLPIADWRNSALRLFKKLCNSGEEASYDVAKALSKKLAIECMTELDSYFNIFGFMDEGERHKWQELSNQLRKIYSS